VSRDLNTGNYLSLPGVKFHVIDTAPSYGPTLSAAGVLMLEAVHLIKRYASLPAVQDLSFSLHPGQVLGCLGPNGSGKSTTVKMLTGLLAPSRGLVQFNGRSIQDDLTAYRNRVDPTGRLIGRNLPGD
jgi:ABC-type uncharacterized transport system ATPase subunit